MEKRVLKLEEGEEIIIVNAKKQTGILIQNKDNNLIVEECKEQELANFQVKNISISETRSLIYLMDFQNHSEELPKDEQQSLNKLMDYYYTKIYGENYNTNNTIVKNEQFQILTTFSEDIF